MSLIERLMGLADDGISPAPDENVDPTKSKIAVHTFAAACFEIALGPRTVAQIKSYWQMDTACAAEFDLMAAQVIGTQAAKLQIIFQFEQVMILSEVRAPFYSTPALVRVRLGL